MLRPESEAELAEAVRSAEGPLAVCGGGTRPMGRPVAGQALTVSGMSGITLYEPGALTLVAKAGTPVETVEEALRAEGQRLAFEPMDHRVLLGSDGVPTLGGVVAANVSGPRRIQAGACRDSLLGVRFVDGNGTVLKNGGRVMKNVTGYDLVKLMAGSFGTLGVLSEVSFKVLPAPETAACLRLEGLEVARAVEAMSLALGSPFEVTGAAYLPAGGGQEATTLIRIEGFDASVAYRTERLREVLKSFGELSVVTDPEEVALIWRDIRAVKRLSAGDGVVWRISVKPTDAPAVIAALPDADFQLDWGGGLIWARTDTQFDLRAALRGIAGHATLVRAPLERRACGGIFSPQSAPLAALAEGLRARFDPRGILNPGLML